MSHFLWLFSNMHCDNEKLHVDISRTFFMHTSAHSFWYCWVNLDFVLLKKLEFLDFVDMDHSRKIQFKWTSNLEFVLSALKFAKRSLLKKFRRVQTFASFSLIVSAFCLVSSEYCSVDSKSFSVMSEFRS